MTADGGGADDPGSRGPRGGTGSFRGWRRSRPFWGGLLMLLAGIELLAIPLSGVLVQGQVRLVIYVGAGGVSGVLIGALLAAAGIAAWADTGHRSFYGITGIILGISSFPASNLGGFLIGMLLAILGGALSFAWAPSGTGVAEQEPALPGPGTSAAGTAPRDHRQAPGNRGRRALAIAGLPCLLFCTPSPGPPGGASPSAGHSSPPASRTAPAAGRNGPFPSLLPATRSRQKPPGGTGRATERKPARQAGPSPGITLPSAVSALTARSAVMQQFRFGGVAALPEAGGRSEKVLEFSAAAGLLSSAVISVTQSGHTVFTRTASLSMPDGMTLYATRLCGRVEGTGPAACFTPAAASQVALRLASVLGKAAPVTMTDVTADQFLDVAPAARWDAFGMGPGR